MNLCDEINSLIETRKIRTMAQRRGYLKALQKIAKEKLPESPKVKKLRKEYIAAKRKRAFDFMTKRKVTLKLRKQGKINPYGEKI